MDTIDAVVAGHICLDVTPEFPRGGRDFVELLKPGTLLRVGPATVCTGGPVSNTGLPLRRLGLDVRLMGKCGDDTFGRAVVECIRQEAPGAEAGMQIVPGEHTSYSVVVNPPGVDRMFLHCPGANDTFTVADVDFQSVRSARLFHFGYPPMMARTYENGGEQLERIFANARDTGATTSLDLTWPDPSGPAGQADWSAILHRTLPAVDLFTPSVEELLWMLQPAAYAELADDAPDGDILPGLSGELLGKLADECIRAGAGVVLIKCGYLGAYVRTSDRRRLGAFGRAKPARPRDWADRELLEPSYRVERIVSTTGAGDCAIAGFLAAYLNGCDLEFCLRHATATGAQNLSAADTVSGIRSWEETVEQVEARPPKNEVEIRLDAWRQDEEEAHWVGPRDGRPARR